MQYSYNNMITGIIIIIAVWRSGGDLLTEDRGQWLKLLGIFGLHVRQEFSSVAGKQLDSGEELFFSNLVVTDDKCIL